MTSLQTELENLKKRSRNWLIALAVAVILLAVLVVTVFRKQPNNPKIDALQQQLESEKARVKVLEEKLPLYDSLLANQQRQLDNNRQAKTEIIHRYEKIPVNTPTDKSGIRREFADY